MDKLNFKIIYETQYGWIGSIGGHEFESFYFITVSQNICSKQVGIKLAKSDVENIMNSNGEESVIRSVLEKTSNAYPGFIEIE